MLKDYDIKIIFTLSVPILTKQENWLEIFIFTRLCGASKGFMKCTGREGSSVMWTEWKISFRVCDLRCVKRNTEKKPNLTILTSLKSQNFLCQPWQSTFNKDVYPWSGGRGKDSSSDRPYKFISPTTKMCVFWSYALNCKPVDFLASIFVSVEKGYHTITFDLIKWHS